MEKELNTNETINSQKPALPKKFGIFSVCYAAVAYAFMIVMWATGWNFFPLVAVVLQNLLWATELREFSISKTLTNI